MVQNKIFQSKRHKIILLHQVYLKNPPTTQVAQKKSEKSYREK